MEFFACHCGVKHFRQVMPVGIDKLPRRSGSMMWLKLQRDTVASLGMSRVLGIYYGDYTRSRAWRVHARCCIP